MADHGQRARYVMGCQCDACTEAARVYAAEWRQRWRDLGWHQINGRWTNAPRRQRAPGEEPPHGTLARYHWSMDRCRCPSCRAANTQAKAVQRRTARRGL